MLDRPKPRSRAEITQQVAPKVKFSGSRYRKERGPSSMTGDRLQGKDEPECTRGKQKRENRWVCNSSDATVWYDYCVTTVNSNMTTVMSKQEASQDVKYRGVKATLSFLESLKRRTSVFHTQMEEGSLFCIVTGCHATMCSLFCIVTGCHATMCLYLKTSPMETGLQLP
ncbi:hypothetical protein E5288_WYG006255 [Bos mutus]|uniref:Uncharacterized protein n=1 Tax=Bos mutus TaxID=72004 RepID=A0A6B0QU30_9CETA|nr:hypothetical protein [Bos mutus]